MALLHHLFTPTTPSRSASLSSSSLAASDSFTRLHKKSIGLNQKVFNGPQVHTPIKLKDRYAVIVKSSSDVDGTDPVPEPPSESNPEGMAVQDERLTRLIRMYDLLKSKNQKLFNGPSSDVDGTGPVPQPPSESKPEVVAVQDLPLESKMQLKQEQKLKRKPATKLVMMYQLLKFLVEAEASKEDGYLDRRRMYNLLKFLR